MKIWLVLEKSFVIYTRTHTRIYFSIFTLLFFRKEEQFLLLFICESSQNSLLLLYKLKYTFWSKQYVIYVRVCTFKITLRKLGQI